MKVLIAVHHFPPRFTGGAEWRAYRTASALGARGHQVRVVAVERIDAGPPAGVAWEDEIFDGVSVRRLSYNLANAPDRLRWEYDNLWIGDHFRQIIQAWPPDLLHVIGGYVISGRPLRVAHEMGVPTVLTLTDFWFLCKRISMLRSDGRVSTLPIDPLTCARCLGEEKRRYRLPGKYLPRLMRAFWRTQTGRINQVERRLDFLRQTLNRVDAIISPSRFLRSTFIQAGVDPGRIVFSRQGRDFPGLKLQEKVPSSTLRVGYVGQIVWHKGLHVLFEAARRLPDAPLSVSVYGDEAFFPDYAQMLRRMAAADPRLKLCGVYLREQVSDVIQQFDVLVVPSLWYENSPNVILEAFAHKIPVIASNLGGMAELVRRGENGLLFETGDPAGLASQLQRLLDEPGLLQTLTRGIEPVRSVAQEMDELEAIYHRAIAHAVVGVVA